MLIAPYRASWVNNDNIHQSLEAIFGDKDIHLLSSVAKEKVGDLFLNMCSISKTIIATISWNVSWATVCSLSQGASKQLGT